MRGKEGRIGYVDPGLERSRVGCSSAGCRGKRRGEEGKGEENRKENDHKLFTGNK